MNFVELPNHFLKNYESCCYRKHGTPILLTAEFIMSTDIAIIFQRDICLKLFASLILLMSDSDARNHIFMTIILYRPKRVVWFYFTV